MKKISIILSIVVSSFAIDNSFLLGLGIGSSETMANSEISGDYYDGSGTKVDSLYTSSSESTSGGTQEMYFGYRYDNHQIEINVGNILVEDSEDSTSSFTYTLLTYDYLFLEHSFRPYVGVALGQSIYKGEMLFDTTLYVFESTSPAYGVRIGFLYDFEDWSLGLKYQALSTYPEIDTPLFLENAYDTTLDFDGHLKGGYENFTSTMFTANYHF